MLVKNYPKVKKAIVAFIPNVFSGVGDPPKPPEFPPIIGTGFIIRENGLIVTNSHVVDAFSSLPKAKEDMFGVSAYLFHQMEIGVAHVPLKVIGVAKPSAFEGGEGYLGPKVPDIAFVQVNAKGLPFITLDSETLLEDGMEVATTGFPMGRDALMAPGWLHQISPTLQTGIISGILPFSCKTPHSLAVNVMIQGGASGSPLFFPDTGKVIGLMYGGLNEFAETHKGDLVQVPTNISYAVPSHFLSYSFNKIQENKVICPDNDALTLAEMVKPSNLVQRKRGESSYIEYPNPDEIK